MWKTFWIILLQALSQMLMIFLLRQPKTEPIPAPVDATTPDAPENADHDDTFAPDMASIDAQLVDTDDPDVM